MEGQLSGVACAHARVCITGAPCAGHVCPLPRGAPISILSLACAPAPVRTQVVVVPEGEISSVTEVVLGFSLSSLWGTSVKFRPRPRGLRG